MARVKSKKCPNCSGPLPTTGDERVIKCEYCGSQIELERPPPQKLPTGSPVPVQIHLPKAAKHAWVFALIPMFLIGMGVFTAIYMQKKAMRAHSDPAGGHSPKGEAIRWDDDVMPAVADVNGDGVADIIGRYAVNENSKSMIYVGAFDGQTFARLWKAGPYGDISANHAHMYTHFVVTPAHVLVTDHSSMVHILDRKSGTEQRSARLSDRANGGCAAPDGEQAWIEVADEKHVSVDLASGGVSDMARPKWCRGEIQLSGSSRCWHSDFQRNRRGRADCIDPRKLAKAEGFGADYALVAGEVTVALGHKKPGTRLPMAAAYVEGKAVWVRNIAGDAQATVGEGTPSVADVAFGRVIIHYQLDQKWRLISLDVTDGKTQWDVLVPNTTWSDESELVLVTEGKIYLPSSHYLHIFDTASGRLIATIGKLY